MGITKIYTNQCGKCVIIKADYKYGFSTKQAVANAVWEAQKM